MLKAALTISSLSTQIVDIPPILNYIKIKWKLYLAASFCPPEKKQHQGWEGELKQRLWIYSPSSDFLEPDLLLVFCCPVMVNHCSELVKAVILFTLSSDLLYFFSQFPSYFLNLSYFAGSSFVLPAASSGSVEELHSSACSPELLCDTDTNNVSSPPPLDGIIKMLPSFSSLRSLMPQWNLSNWSSQSLYM